MQQVLKTFNTIASKDKFKLLYNNNDNNKEILPLHKVNIIFYLINNNIFFQFHILIIKIKASLQQCEKFNIQYKAANISDKMIILDIKIW